MKNSDIWVKVDNAPSVPCDGVQITIWRRRSGSSLFYASTMNGEYPTPDSVLWVGKDARVTRDMGFVSALHRWDVKPLIVRVGVAI